MISVCAPYWQRQAALNGMIEQYADLYADLDIEVVIADDGSPVPAYAPPTRLAVRIVRLPEKSVSLNPCVAMNAAVRASRGDVLVLTNPETRHDGPVLLEALALLEDERDYVTARCYGTGYPGGKLWLAGPEVDYRTRGRLPVPDGAHFHFLAVLHRTLWDEAGGFDEEYRHFKGCDDNDWLWRLDRVGVRFRCTEGCVSQPRGTSDWKLPHGRALFARKWPDVLGVPA